MLDAELISPPPLRGYRELAAGRAALDAHLARLDDEGVVQLLETLLDSSVRCRDNSDVLLASWLLRVNGDERAGLRSAAERVGRELAAALLGAPLANRGLLPRGRLREVGISANAPVRYPMRSSAVALHMGAGWSSSGAGDHRFRFAELHAHARHRQLAGHYTEQLCAHPDAGLIRRLLDAPWLGVKDVLKIASRRPITPELAFAVAESDRWFSNPEVRRALAANRFAPPQLLLSLLPTLGSAQLRWLSDPRVQHPHVAHAAELLVNRRRRGGDMASRGAPLAAESAAAAGSSTAAQHN